MGGVHAIELTDLKFKVSNSFFCSTYFITYNVIVNYQNVQLQAIFLFRFFPQSKAFFVVLFSLACGPIAILVTLLRIPLDFYFRDKMISLYIHMAPALTVYV